MTDDRWRRLSLLVPDALALPRDGRAAYLDATCTRGDGTPDAALRAEAQTLVESALAAEASGAFASPVAGRAEALPDRIGPWRVTGLLGRGGMGVVYAAERADDSFEQRAALKVVHPGFVADFGPRFIRERALLAALDHSGIARLLDGGVAADGTPYLAMERVDGPPITAAAEAAGLDVAARVRLFAAACDAVAYAHRALVVHRDLKPDHIRVEDAEGRQRVKLLDFGIARLVGDGADPLQTRTVAGPLTPAYAAPEQLLGRPVTTATDVYALGVVLYELLAGRRPYDLSRMTAAQAERAVCAGDAPLPSAVAPPERARALRGDLDTIVRKALSTEPARRYASAEALGADLRRHLAGLPVEARPATARYRAGRFVRRHRVGVGAGALAAVLAVALSALYTVRLRAERDLAARATVAARAEADRAEAISGFLEQILRAPNARWNNEGAATGPDTPVRDVLDAAAARVDRDFADRPDLLADLHHLLGDTYGALGLGGEAYRHHRRTLALRERLYAPPDPRIAEALYYVAVTLPAARGRETIPLLERALAMQRLRNEGNNFPFVAADLASFYVSVGRAADAAALGAEGRAFAEARFRPGDDGHRYRDVILLVLSQGRARALQQLGRLGEAAAEVARADSLLARLPRTPAHEGFWQFQMCVAGSQLRRQRRFAEAEPRLLACAGVGPPRAPASPYPAPRDGDPPPRDRRDQQEQSAAELVALYEAWGRPARAAPFRALAARHRVRADSLRAVLTAP